MTDRFELISKDVSEDIPMDYTNIHVLLTDGAARQTLTILHGLKEAGCKVTVLCGSKLDVCYNSKLPDKKILDDLCESRTDGYIEYVLSLLKTGVYDVIVPISELTTNKITQNEEIISKYTKIAGASRSAYIQAFDKQRTFELAVSTGMPCPKTRMIGKTVEEFLSTVNFPLIIKPRNGVGSIGFHKFEKAEDFWPYIKANNIDLDQYVLQEFVNYKKRLGAILFVDQNGDLCTAYANEILRWYPIDAGTATTIRSIDNPRLLEDSYNLLKKMNWAGVAALSFMLDETTGEPKLCEINGRVPASIKLSWVLGYNIGQQLIEMALDQEVKKYPPNKKAGMMTRHSQAELAWFVHSKERFTCKPSWFSWKNAYDLVYWKGDLKPFVTYTIQQILGYKTNMKKREH
jgi:D-aspartate ligase